MKKKGKMFVVKHGTYPFDVLFCLDVEYCDVLKELKRLGQRLNEKEREELEMRGIGRTVMLLNGQSVIRIESLKDKARHYSNIAHEIFHAVEFLFDRIGIELGDESGEAFAYQIQYLTEQIYRKGV
jgi:hypothetical protein